MRIIENEKYIQRRAKVGEWAPLVGLGCLFGSVLIMLSYPQLALWGTLLLGVGFVASMLGNYYGDRFVGKIAYHVKLQEALKGLNDQYTLLLYTQVVSFVLLEPGGVTVLVVKPQSGTVRYADGRWRHQQRGKFLRQLAGQESLIAPAQDASQQAKRMADWLAKQLPEEVAASVPVRGVLVFAAPDVRLEIESSVPVAALLLKDLKPWLRKEGRLSKLPQETRQALAEVFALEEAATADD